MLIFVKGFPTLYYQIPHFLMFHHFGIEQPTHFEIVLDLVKDVLMHLNRSDLVNVPLAIHLEHELLAVDVRKGESLPAAFKVLASWVKATTLGSYELIPPLVLLFFFQVPEVHGMLVLIVSLPKLMHPMDVNVPIRGRHKLVFESATSGHLPRSPHPVNKRVPSDLH